jgi:hypothetical protein
LLRSGAREERTDDFGLADVGELCAALGVAANKVPKGLAMFLMTSSEIPGVSRAQVRALEITHEGLDQIAPVEDLVRGQVFEPSSH